jgi:hypothetical protein
MAVLKKMIIVENKLKFLFSKLPPILNSNSISFQPVFKWGDSKELSVFLKTTKKSTSPYPLIWLVSPFAEQHKRTHVLVENMSLVLAVETNKSMLNEQRIEETYTKVLIPLFENIKELFLRSNIVNTSDEYNITKFYNYSGDSNTGDKNEVTDIWDAMKITFDIQINNNCSNL